VSAAALIAIDWGTTSARAYRVAHDGDVLDQRSAPLGISQVSEGRFAEALDRLLGDWRDERVPRLASGMIGSRQGWVEAPYIACPAPLAALASSLAYTPQRELAIVPGVRTRDANDVPDVMRGEETQILGGVDRHEQRVLLALPGTHSKWALVESGRIVDFATFMTGEMWHVLVAHSILGRLAVQGISGAPPGPGYARGVARGIGNGPLLHDVFGARTLALMGELAPEDVTDWLSGLMIGREVRNARIWAHQHGYDGARVRLIGDDALVARYATAFAQDDVTVEAVPAHAAARGLWQIARSAGLIHDLR
jgi:2-dehydro-3-deoxygalactonokinase